MRLEIRTRENSKNAGNIFKIPGFYEFCEFCEEEI